MATNLQIEEGLIQEAVRLGGHRTKKAAVTQALLEYNRRLRQMETLSLFGTVDFDPDYDYREQRRRG
jgi:Arc/MetJ family transcription regulator